MSIWGRLRILSHHRLKARNRNDRKQKRPWGRLSQQDNQLTPNSLQKTDVEPNDLATTLPKKSVTTTTPQDSLQPAGPQEFFKSDTRATEETSASTITPVAVLDVPHVLPLRRQQTLRLEVDSINQANPTGGLQEQQFESERLCPRWESTRGRSQSMPPSPEVSHKRTPPPIVGEDPPTESVFPHAIAVLLRLTFNGQPESLIEQEINGFDWTRPDSYKRLMPQKMVRKLQDLYEELKTQEMYRRYSSCRIEGPRGQDYDSPVSIVDDYEQLSQRAIINACAFIAQHSFKSFRLNVHWDYGSAQVQKPNEEQLRKGLYPKNYITMIRKELQKKVQKNFLDQEYIPRGDLNVFLKLEVIDNILVEDQSLALEPAELKRFREDILLNSPKLFAICVYCEIEMKLLHHLMQKHGRGDNPAKRPQRGRECGEDGCHNHNLRQIISALPTFFAEKIEFNYQHRDLDHDQILPLQHTGDLDSQGMVKRNELGEGSSGKVFAVKIDLTHNSVLPGNPDSRFAIKEHHHQDSFDREREILKRFVDFPNPHIVQHLTTWSQRNLHYILYNKARCNLRTYINNLQNPDLTGPHVLWFLGQLKGLASAIAHVHNFRMPSLSNPKPTDDDYWGRHDDIKPENILVFEKVDNQNPIFKIADFGLGVFYKPTGFVSRQDPLNNGTEGYFPPEKVKSRPFDMWALGCVFLELLLWLFGFYQDPSDRGFVTARMSFPGQDPSRGLDNFWFEVDGRPGVYRRKPAVEAALDDLKNKHCQGMRAFQDILSAINKLLEVDPSKRYESGVLLDKLSVILIQAEADIKGQNGDPDYYRKKLRENLGGTEYGRQLPSAGVDPDISPFRTRSHSFSSQHSRFRSNSGGQAMLANMNPAPGVSAQSEDPGWVDTLRAELDALT